MTNILCIDIGGTRIKAAILKNDLTLKELENTNVKTMETLGWLNSSLPQIIAKDHFASLVNIDECLKNYDIVAIGVPFKVNNKEKKVEGYYINENGVPGNLMQAFKDRTNCEVLITNDSMAWLYGALNYYKLLSKEIKFPCLTVTLGTGVGLAYADSYSDIKGIEASEQKYVFSHLSNSSNENVYRGAEIHKVLGEKFFRDVKDSHQRWTYLKIQNQYTERLISLFKDFEETNLFNYEKIKSIIIGGGYLKYVCLSSLKSSLNKSIYMLSENYIQINPDLIPLFGLVQLINQQPPT